MAISVTVCIDQTWATCETDIGYNPDVLDDLTTQAVATVLADVKAMT